MRPAGNSRSYQHCNTILFLCQEGLAPLDRETRARSLGQTVTVVDDQLGVNAAPVLPSTCLFLRNILRCQIKQLEQAVIGREYGTRLCYLPKLPVEAFDRVGGIDKLPKLRRKFEVGA